MLRQFQNVEYTGRLRGLQPHPPPPAPPHPLHFSRATLLTHCISAAPCPPLIAFQQCHAPHPLHSSRAMLLKVATSIQWSEPETGHLSLVPPSLSPLLSSLTVLLSYLQVLFICSFLFFHPHSFHSSLAHPFLSAELLPIHPHCWEALKKKKQNTVE